MGLAAGAAVLALLAAIAAQLIGWGIWLPLTPGRDGSAQARVATTLRVQVRLFALLLPYRAAISRALAVTVALTAATLLRPLPTKFLVDDVLGSRRLFGLSVGVVLILTAILTAAFFTLGGALTLYQTKLLYGLSQRLIRDLRVRVFEHLTRLSLTFHDGRSVGDSTYRVATDTYALHSVLVDGLVPLTTAVLTLAGTTVVLIRIDPVLALLSVVTVPAAAIVSHRYGLRIQRSSLQVHDMESQVYTYAERTLGDLRTVQAFGMEGHEVGEFAGRADSSAEAMVTLVVDQTKLGLLVDALLGIGLALVTYVAGRRALSGHLTTGDVLVVLAYVAALYAPIAALVGLFAELQSATAGAQRVFEVLDEATPLEPPRADRKLAPARGEVGFDGVTFGYQPGQPVLKNVSFVAAPGELVAIVGPTGAGKSTLAALLLRLYDVSEGAIRLDDTPIAGVSLAWLREQIAFVPQEPPLFPVSVRENIRYGRLAATDDEVEQAAREANLLEELQADPRGLDALVGERGLSLSGGQRQRVAIARALLRDAPITLLDEPTSALDAVTEAKVMAAIVRLVEGRTAIVIAHRLATVERADRIVVLDGGRVVQVGTHARLLRQRGLYRELHAARFGRQGVATDGAAR